MQQTNTTNDVEKRDCHEQPLIYRKSTVCKKLDISKATLDRWINRGIFPTPIVLGEPGVSRSVGWSAVEVEEWLQSRPRAIR